ncbi:MAG: hypothetical protein K2X45_10600 [Phreatobacter sp.]|nr:hypothetical protein [Phreatobacter sp.]
MTYTSIQTIVRLGNIRLPDPKHWTTGTPRFAVGSLQPSSLPAAGPSAVHWPMRADRPTQHLLPLHGGIAAPQAPSVLRRRVPDISGGIAAPPSLEQLIRPPVSGAVWADPTIQSRLAPTISVQIYAGGTYALKDLRYRLNATTYKVGSTSRLSPHDRFEELRTSQYGCMRMDATGHWYGEPGFEDWILVAVPREIRVAMASCVVILPESIGVRLPLNMTAAAFEAELAARLAPFEIGRWARSESGKRALLAKGVDPLCTVRGTRVIENGFEIVREAREFYPFRPYRDFEALISLAEEIVLEAVT